MNEALTNKLLARELQKRQAPVPNILSECFPEQLAFIKDPAKRKKACLTRRSGKSTTAGIYLIQLALDHPRSKSVYVGLTKDTAKKVMWTDIFETIILKHKIPAKLVGLQIRFSNGSIIQLTGADATYKEKDKLRGEKNIIAVIDECQSFTQDLETLVNSVILPTLTDLDGTLCMIGTPGNQMGLHYWWQINDPKAEGNIWQDFHWTWRQNPHVKDNIEKYLEELIAANPLIETTTGFKQEWLGQWVIEESARVYQSTRALNYISSLPSSLLDSHAVHLLSVDLGYTDASAFVVSCYNQNFNDKMYVLESSKIPKLTISGVAEKIKDYQKRYNFRLMVVDAANRQAVEEMRLIHALPLWAADKAGKEAHISILNSDFKTANVLILAPTNPELIKELESLIWDQRAILQGKHKEDPRKENHLTDALLYGHHASRHYWYQPKIIINPNSEDQIRKVLFDKHLQTLNIKPASLEVSYDSVEEYYE